MLAPTTTIGLRHKRVALQNAGPDVPDGSGGFVPSWVDLPPPADVRISAASTGALEQIAAGSAVLASATHLVTLPYRAGVSTKTRVLVEGRALYVSAINDPEERHVELVLVCEEKVL